MFDFLKRKPRKYVRRDIDYTPVKSTCNGDFDPCGYCALCGGHNKKHRDYLYDDPRANGTEPVVVKEITEKQAEKLIKKGPDALTSDMKAWNKVVDIEERRNRDRKD